ncbi:hypothetical protein QC999_gp79 [Microbacterium phage Cressida]|uniref:Uncharacterized protein n=1 Tax=Microbacterium phage Cressida TaxID=2591216 RepID=A0A514DI31_9CAUD|nr:hypothetical protein QC999_gp79 [Microbacterium phage Cressida]QDH93271.1 hypothetical protein PBI_CRESSIDA_29 [Microbacterium phage Cressida]
MAKDRIGPLMDVYVKAAVAVLNPTPDRIVYYQPGEEVAWDGGCVGQLAARVIAIDMQAPQANGQGLICGGNWWNVRLGLSLIRCVASVDSEGRRVKIPTPEEITQDGAQMLADIAALQEVIMCAGYTAAAPAPAWQPLGPNGGQAGGEWQFTVRTSVCACPSPLPWDHDGEPETPEG